MILIQRQFLLCIIKQALMFNNSQVGFNSFAQNSNTPANGIFGSKPTTGGIFGGSQPTGGVFGATNNGVNNNGNNAFGNTNQTPNPFGQPNQGQNAFGNMGGNMTGNNGQGIFGNNNQPQGQGIFNNNQNGQGTGIFNNSTPQQQNGQGIFGGQSNNTGGIGGGVFGQPQQQQTPGIFGNIQQQNNTTSNGIFGGNQNNNNNNFGVSGGIGNGMGGGIGAFGAASNDASRAFLGNNNNTSNPFGNNTNPSNPFANTGGNNAFAGNNNTGNNMFGGVNNNTNNIFGGNNNNNTNVFGASNNMMGNNTPQQTNAGGLFNTFAPSTTNQTNNAFLGGQQNNNLGTSSFLGNKPAFNTTNNALGVGGTNWGVPTLNNTPSLGNALTSNNGMVGGAVGVGVGVGVGVQTLQPVKSKNSKLDAKHLIKCISALDQFGGAVSKEEIRINYIQSGGQQPAFNQQQTFQANNNMATGFKPFTANTSTPAFGGLGGLSSNNIPSAGSNNFFGSNTNTQNTFGQGMGNTPSNSAFAQALGTAVIGQTQNSIFGQTHTTPAFGQTQNTPMFGQPQQNNSFFNQTTPQPTNNLFGNPGGNSMFGAQTAPQTTPMFTQPANMFNNQPTANSWQTSTPSLFGQQPQTNTMFGAQTTPTLFGQNQGTVMGGAPNLFGNTQVNPAFNTVQPTAQPGFFNQPLAQPNLFGSNSIYPQNGFNLQSCFPQLILAMALSQPEHKELVHKLTTILQHNNSATPNKTQEQSFSVKADAIEEMMKEVDREYNIKKPKVLSLFSDEERQAGTLRQFIEYPKPIIFEDKPVEQPIKVRFVKTDGSDSFLNDYTNEYNLNKMAKKYKASKQKAYRKIEQLQKNLPNVGKFGIYPSLDMLKRMTDTELMAVQNVRIWNKFGEVEFLEPISLLKLDLEEHIIISQDNIEIKNVLEEKSVRMTFRNFGKYTTLKEAEQESMTRKMKKWIAKYDMKQVSHDKNTGDLVVEVDN